MEHSVVIRFSTTPDGRLVCRIIDVRTGEARFVADAARIHDLCYRRDGDIGRRPPATDGDTMR